MMFSKILPKRFFIRKSWNFGLVRINLSKSGIGLSLGIPGLRWSIGPKGRAINAGKFGLYYRKNTKWGKQK